VRVKRRDVLNSWRSPWKNKLRKSKGLLDNRQIGLEVVTLETAETQSGQPVSIMAVGNLIPQRSVLTQCMSPVRIFLVLVVQVAVIISRVLT